MTPLPIAVGNGLFSLSSSVYSSSLNHESALCSQRNVARSSLLIDVAAVIGGALLADGIHLHFVAIVAAEFDQVVVGQVPAQLAEDQVFLEGHVLRAEHRLHVGRQVLHVARGIGRPAIRCAA